MRGRKERRAGRENLRSSKDELMKLGSFLCGYFKGKALVIKKTKGNVNTQKEILAENSRERLAPKTTVFSEKRQFPLFLPLNWMRAKGENGDL